jgi:putative spermidine/putrescine transport system permease protein
VTSSAGARDRGLGTAWLLSTPAVLLVAFLAIAPSLRLLVEAFRTLEGTGPTLANFADLMDSRIAAQAFWRTLRVSIITTALSVVAGYPMALLIAKAGRRLSGLLLTILVFPLMVSVVVRAFGWRVILGPSGLVNQALMATGLIDQPLPLVLNEVGIIIGETQLLIPYMVLSLLAVLRKVDPHLEEAALSLGANPVVTFLRVILPISLPGLMSGVLLVFSLAMTAFATPLLLGGARTPLLTTLLYSYVFSSYDWASAAAVATVLVMLALVFVTVQRWVTQVGMKGHG